MSRYKEIESAETPEREESSCFIWDMLRLADRSCTIRWDGNLKISRMGNMEELIVIGKVWVWVLVGLGVAGRVLKGF